MRFVKLLTVALSLFVLYSDAKGTSSIGYWEFDEGGDEKIVKDGSGKGNSGIISGTSWKWAREDDRGFFLQFNGGPDSYVRINNSTSLNLKKKFTIEMQFSCDLSAIDGVCTLLSKGGGYSININKEGIISVNFNGLTPNILSSPAAKIQSNVDYFLNLSYDGEKISMSLNDKEILSSMVKGMIVPDKSDLYIGGLPASRSFKGNLYMLKIYDDFLTSEKTTTKLPEEKQKPLNHKTANGVIYFYDFEKMEPSSAISLYKYEPGKWVLRGDAKFMDNGRHVLYPPDNDGEDITWNPDVKGYYDLYVGIRAAGSGTQLQVKTTKMTDFFTVTTPPLQEHKNCDILLSRNMKMDGQSIILHGVGDKAYIDYIKLVPSVEDKKDALVTIENKKDVEFKTEERLSSSPRYKERFFVDDKKMPELSKESQESGYVIFPISYMDLSFPNTIPNKDDGNVKLHLAAVPGEFEPVSFCIRTLKELKNISIKKSPLKNENAEIPESNIDIGIVENFARRTTNYFGACEYMNGPQYIESRISEPIPADTTRQFWVTIKVPENAVTGTYKGKITLLSSGESRDILLTLEVYKFKLDDLKDYNIGMFTSSMHIGFPDMAGELQDMKAHGMTSVFIFPSLLPNLKFKGQSPSEIKIDFENSILFAVLDEFNRLKFGGNICLQTSNIENFCNRFLPDENAYETAYVSIIKQLDNYCKDKGYSGIIYQPHDEVPSHPASFPAFTRELKCLKKAGAITESDHLWYKTSRSCQKEIDKCVDLIDIFTLRYNNRNLFYVDPWEEMEKKCSEMGKKLYAYNSNNACSFAHPMTMRFMHGWFFRTAGKKTMGQFTWVYQYPSGSPYSDFDSDCTDWMYHYPPYEKNGRLGGSSIDWECMREGIDDLKYVVTLENLIKKCKDTGFDKDADDAESLLAGIKNSVNLEMLKKECTFLEQKWEKKGVLSDGRLFAEGKWFLPMGWDSENYNGVRRKVALKINELHEKLNK